MLTEMKKWRLDYLEIVALVICALLVGAAPAAAQASSPDVALVTKITGEVSYGSEGGPLKPAQTFMKIRQGDQFKVPKDGALQFVFFANGRQETWSGPSNLVIGDAAGQATGEKEPLPKPEVIVLPAKATRRLVDAAPLSGASLRYTGAIQTMAPQTTSPLGKPVQPLTAAAQIDLKEAKKTYHQMLKKASADDVTPELYYLSVLADYGQTAEMAEVVAAMAAKRPGDAAVKRMQDWVRAQSAPRP